MTATSRESAEPAHAFEIKSGPVNLPILKLLTNDVFSIIPQLRQKVGQAPDFFRRAPMALDLHLLAAGQDSLDIAALATGMQDCGLIPVGVCGGNDQQQQAAIAAGLAVLTLARHEPPPVPAKPKESAAEPGPQASPPPEAKPKPAKTPPATANSRIIEQPIRSGQRIYVPGGDLVAMATVSAGAEIMADGNIHVYGTLRGRALAGVQGDLTRRIFCHDLQAELVAIGGHYQISENIDDSVRGVPVQIFMQDQSLIIQKL